MNDLSSLNPSVKDKVRELLDKQSASGHHTFRRVKDSLSRYAIAIGGVSVILAVVMIFFYLLYVVFPIFKSAEVKQEASYPFPAAASVLWGMEEYGEIGFNLNPDGEMLFFDAHNGQKIDSIRLTFGDEQKITQAVYANREENLLAIGLNDGSVLFVKQEFRISYPNNKRHITPAISYPFGEEPNQLFESAISRLAVAKNEEQLSIVASSGDFDISYLRFALEESFLGDGISLEEVVRQEFSSDVKVDYLLHDPSAQWVYAISNSGDAQTYWYEDKELQSNEKLRFVEQKSSVKDVQFLLGGSSLLVADSKGSISQWFPVRDEKNNFRLHSIRQFEFNNAAAKTLFPEVRRKGFIAINENNELGIFFSTSHRTLMIEPIEVSGDDTSLVLNPRGNRMLIRSGEKVQNWNVYNEHPDLSWSALWGKVWYESYPEPQYTWQSSASTNDFEAKFSLVPLSFGTLKAAFYAMLFAMPLAICGAIFTAYFMAPGMRSLVKPAIEIMEALPTVILGFLAGLWLAPAMEENLPGVFMILLLMPLGIILFGAFWYWLPSKYKAGIPEGWQAALLIPVVVFIGWACLEVSYPLEKVMFDGDMRVWLESLGINYDQRNSLVVGIAMGFAVIPTIFSITEDAIFSVPRHLTNGSLALGASAWQTLVRVVLPTASPGIFSAVMIGLGRAVGETMIVLMATGNTPIMEANIFEGMRTLSANIAVEMPESEVGSSHYRVLFLAGFVLFVFTFIFNTVAENVRHRLRKKYGSL